MSADTGKKKETKKPLLRLIGLGKNETPPHQKNPGGKDAAVELQQVADQNRQTGQPESKHVVLQQLWQDKPNTLLKHIREGKLEAVKLVFAPLDELSKKQLFATARDDEGNSLFLLAAKHGQYEVCQWLWAQNLAVREDRNTEKMTALLLAAQSGYNNIVRWLLDKEEPKASIQESANGKNALLWAASGYKTMKRKTLLTNRNDHEAVIEFLATKHGLLKQRDIVTVAQLLSPQTPPSAQETENSAEIDEAKIDQLVKESNTVFQQNLLKLTRWHNAYHIQSSLVFSAQRNQAVATTLSAVRMRFNKPPCESESDGQSNKDPLPLSTDSLPETGPSSSPPK